MATRSPDPRNSAEELARRGDAIYDREVAPRLRPEDEGKFVAIDVETGAFETAADELAASDRLRAHHPEAQIWFRRAGSRYTHRFGARREPRPNPA